MSKSYKIVELFSGIGSQAKALKNLGVDIDVQATCEWDIHALIAYDAIHNSTEIIPEAAEKSKDELFNLLKDYTLSNNGKEAMQQTTLHTYSEEVMRRTYTAIKRTKNLVDISKVSGKEMPEETDLRAHLWCAAVTVYGIEELHIKKSDKMRKAFENSFFCART